MTANPAGFGVRSMYARLARVAVRTPSVAGDFAAAGWRAAPDPGRIRDQHAAFVHTLLDLGTDVVVLGETPGQVDSVYAYDAAFVTGRGAIVLNPAKPARQGEAAIMERSLDALGVPVIGRLANDATADGGDLMWLDDSTLAMGRGFRTNAAAHTLMRSLLAEEGVDTVSFDMPYGRGPDHCLHLMSSLSLVGPQVAVVFPPQLPIALHEWLVERDYTLVDVTEAEYDLQGCNVLATGPNQAVIFSGVPHVVGALEAAGVEVHEVDGDQFVLGDGGPTCLTRPLLRVTE
ncbi:amidinotransferase [Nostocoides sp. F2B08]|uniref:dimethylarginine dimethylaminohydrolase family protein n=1 Tax=Nostocoides sp. F2B08 TaxID=2653936 RepID=UPI00126306F7|nr:arginine deiminase family protein [Tetrasphaera sp. F2B08]KAB7744070.1 amidinotransferase [Tetrasphaera sp. F2B08]